MFDVKLGGKCKGLVTSNVVAWNLEKKLIWNQKEKLFLIELLAKAIFISKLWTWKKLPVHSLSTLLMWLTVTSETLVSFQSFRHCYEMSQVRYCCCCCCCCCCCWWSWGWSTSCQRRFPGTTVATAVASSSSWTAASRRSEPLRTCECPGTGRRTRSSWRSSGKTFYRHTWKKLK